MTPVVRVLRTLFQVVLAEAAAIPTVVATLGFDADTTAKIGAVCGAVVVLVTAGWNAAESFTGKTLGAVPSCAGAVGGAADPPLPAPPSSDPWAQVRDNLAGAETGVRRSNP